MQQEIFEKMQKTAALSACGTYRYELSRVWNKDKPKVMFLMLNPSTADANKDDATRRCIGFAKSWGYGGIYVGNMFAYRATDPKELYQAADPFGPLNYESILRMALRSDKIVCAWGCYNVLANLGKTYWYLHIVEKLLIYSDLYCIDLDKHSNPKHPLYLRGDLQPVLWRKSFINDELAGTLRG